MAWFDQLKQALPAYYPAAGPSDVVGYLRGSVDPNVWRNMETVNKRNQMVVLGSKPPTSDDWVAAGVPQRGPDQVLRLPILSGFIVLYGGFVRRPWGKIFVVDADALKQFPLDLGQWQRNYTPPRT